jgi:hypothetical protein
MIRSESPNVAIENAIAARRLAARDDALCFAQTANKIKIISRARSIANPEPGGKISCCMAIAISTGHPSDHILVARRIAILKNN